MERRRMFVAVVGLCLAGSAGSGCRGLLGIDDEAPLLARPADDGDGAGPGGEAGVAGDGAVPDGTSEGGDADGGLVPVDRRFAQWPLPPVSPLLSQYDLTPDTVTDKTTSLVWQRNEPVPVSMSYPAAAAYCEDLTLAGQSDWRLPTRIELLTTLDYGQAGATFVNKTVFPDGTSAGGTIAWTASLSLLHAKLDERMTLDLHTSATETTTVAQSSLLVRCLRGGPSTSPVDRYALSGATARDVRTGLLWQVAPAANNVTLAAAQSACAASTLAGLSGWRLPTLRELLSLVDESREKAPLLAPIFSAGISATLKSWSSTDRTSPNNATFAVDFATGTVTPETFSTGSLSVRCVR